MYHGMGDEGVSALGTAACYDSLTNPYGTSKGLEFAPHLNLVRNTGHSRVGTDRDTFDGFAALKNWLESDSPPEALMSIGGQPSRKTPLFLSRKRRCLTSS